jgi:hypothetical protein
MIPKKPSLYDNLIACSTFINIDQLGVEDVTPVQAKDTLVSDTDVPVQAEM